ncbi:MAG TPA: TRAM domain-containing protein [Candidatus Saccharimonadales bacterium]|nr:TRAM domain-containing protein [Candidatus Saccharimonadales bacterium]
MEEVKITKLVHGGQGLGELGDGRKVFVWNALPGEKVRARVIKKKRSYAEAIAEEILEPSKERIAPKEENYLATSPWQIMTFKAENKYKKQIVEELFAHEKVKLPKFGEAASDGNEWHYRNKMEYSFWGDNDGLHLALHQRGSHGKQIVTGSQLAMPAIDAAANAICAQLSKMNARAGDLKTIVVRCSQKGEVVAALFTKLQKFKQLGLTPEVKGLRVYYSNPKSPASVPTKLLYEVGDVLLHDDLLGKGFTYDVDSFFQVNIPVFKQALRRIQEHCAEPDITDMYAGVGSIGLSVASDAVDLVELDSATSKMAGVNASASGLTTRVIETSTEQALDYITADRPVIFDPPRAGLHDKVVERVLEAKPPKVIYLSCNPATQARDLSKLQQAYKIEFFETYNFFPRTPHIEALAVLTLL